VPSDAVKVGIAYSFLSALCSNQLAVAISHFLIDLFFFQEKDWVKAQNVLTRRHLLRTTAHAGM